VPPRGLSRKPSVAIDMIPESTFKAAGAVSPRAADTAVNSPQAGVDGDQPEEAYYRRYNTIELLVIKL
jgi:hypothetical protein